MGPRLFEVLKWFQSRANNKSLEQNKFVMEVREEKTIEGKVAIEPARHFYLWVHEPDLLAGLFHWSFSLVKEIVIRYFIKWMLSIKKHTNNKLYLLWNLKSYQLSYTSSSLQQPKDKIKKIPPKEKTDRISFHMYIMNSHKSCITKRKNEYKPTEKVWKHNKE